MNNTKKYNYTALLLCAIACCTWSYLLDLKYYRLGYYSWDLALYAQLMWSLCHGHMSTSLFGGNFLIDHFNPIAFLLVPFYFFCQSALTILYFKLVAFFAGAYIFYLLTSKRLGGSWGIAFMLVYMFYPANMAVYFFEFNFENLALPLIFLLFYYFEERQYTGFIITCGLLTLVKENMPLAVLMFGIYGLITRREDWQRWGLYPLLIGAGMFVAEVFLFIPWFRHGMEASNAHWSLYARLGLSPQQVIHTILFNEPKIFKILFNAHNGIFLLQLFGPLLLVAIWAPWTLFLAIPFFLQDLLSKFSGQQSIDYFYSSTLAVFIFVAAVDCLGRIKADFKSYVLSLMLALLLIFDLSYMHHWRGEVPLPKEEQIVSHAILAQIPSDAGVIASYKFLYLLSQRKDLYALFLKQKVYSLKKEIIADDVQYMAVNFSGHVDNKDTVEELLSQGRWTVAAAADEVILLRKNRPYGKMLIESASSSFSKSGSAQSIMMIGDFLIMEDIDIPSSLKARERILPVVFYWKALQSVWNIKFPRIFLSISKGSQRLYLKNISPFYGLPIEEGKYYKQTFYYFIPPLDPGDYRVEIFIPPTVNAYSKNIFISKR